MQKIPSRWVVAAILVAVVYLVWLTHPTGLGATPDTANYLAAARAFADTGSLTILGDRDLVWWPPLFPILWGLALKLGLAPLAAAHLLNLIALMAFAWAWAQLCFQRLQTVSLGWMSWLFILLALANIRIFAHSLSEPSFLALIAWALVWLLKAYKSESYRPLVYAAILTSLACFSRYLGTTLLLTGGILLAFQPYDWAKKAKRLAIWCAIGAGPLLAWLLRNWFISSSFTGIRPPPTRDMATNVEASIWAGIHWLIPQPDLSQIWTQLSLGLGMAVLVYFLWLAKSRVRNIRPQNYARIDLIAMVLFCAIYLICFLVLASLTYTSLPNTRFIAPIMAPICLAAGLVIEATLAQRWLKGRSPFIWLGWGLLGILLLNGYLTANRERTIGWGINNAFWQKSALIHQIRQLPFGITIYSNFRPELYLQTARDGIGLPQKTPALPRFSERLLRTGGAIAWSNIPAKARKPYDFQTLMTYFPNLEMQTFPDGWLVIIPVSPPSNLP